jgi:hypothetical protein
MQAILTSWQNFYNIIGSASATLTGLLFVATTLIAGIEQKNAVTNAGLSAFTTPTFVHFCAVLLLTAIFSAPWPTVMSVSLVLGFSGLGGVIYLIIVIRLMRRVPDYHTPIKDWLWYLAFPLFAYVFLISMAIALPANPGLVLYFINATMIALLFIGIHNAWDLVTYLAVERAHPETKDRN